jgi:hypothetical protein
VDLEFQAVAGTTYSIVVDARDEGAFYQLSFATVPPPVNDAFAARLLLTGSSVVLSGDNSMATAEPGEPPIYSFPPFLVLYASNTLWWTWTAPASGTLKIEPQPDEITAFISIFTGNTLATLTRLTDPFGASTSIEVVKGVTYAISADALGGQTGHFTTILTMDTVTPAALSLALVAPDGIESGQLELRGPPQAQVRVLFSPNLRDWYPWSTNTLSGAGSASISIQPQPYFDDDGTGTPAQPHKRFFRAVSP